MSAANQSRHSPEIIAAVQQLLTIAMQTPRSVADVQFEFSAHCDVVSIRVHPHGWHTGADAKLDEHVYVSGDDQAENLIRLREKLEAFLGECVTASPRAAEEARAQSMRAAAARLLAEADALAPALADEVLT